MQDDVENYIRTCTTCLKKNQNPALNAPTLGRTTNKPYAKAKVWSADILYFNQPSGKFNSLGGSNLVLELFEAVCDGLNYNHKFTEPYSPQGNPVERVHRSLNEHLRILLDDLHESAWGQELDKVGVSLYSYHQWPFTVRVDVWSRPFAPT